jgi:hypothetical protein
MNGVAVTPLTVDFHEGGFRSKLNSESKAPFWFQMDGDARQQHCSPLGPANPQALNRYAYVQNNPLKCTDPTGHTVYLSQDAANELASALNIAAMQIALGGGIAGGVAEIAHRIWAAHEALACKLCYTDGNTCTTRRFRCWISRLPI